MLKNLSANAEASSHFSLNPKQEMPIVEKMYASEKFHDRAYSGSKRILNEDIKFSRWENGSGSKHGGDSEIENVRFSG